MLLNPSSPPIESPSLSPGSHTNHSKSFFPLTISPPSPTSPPLTHNNNLSKSTSNSLLTSTSSLDLLLPPPVSSSTNSSHHITPQTTPDLTPTHKTTPSTTVFLDGKSGGGDTIQIDVELSQQAYSMLENYLNEGASFCINISDRTRTMIIAAISAYGNSGQSIEMLKHLIIAFEQTKKEIFDLMESDSFRRYLKTEEFENFRKEFIQTNFIQANSQHLSLIKEENTSKTSSHSKGMGSKSKGGIELGMEGGDIRNNGSKTQPLGNSCERDEKSISPTTTKESLFLSDESQSGLIGSASGLELGVLKEEGEHRGPGGVDRVDEEGEEDDFLVQ
jgi:hypothetical protein